jgi:hypothetical protein
MDIKNQAMPLFINKINSYVDASRMPNEVISTVRWDMLHFCMECEYSDVFPPGFYASLMYWYVNGYFPCGWEGGEFPKKGIS